MVRLTLTEQYPFTSPGKSDSYNPAALPKRSKVAMNSLTFFPLNRGAFFVPGNGIGTKGVTGTKTGVADVEVEFVLGMRIVASVDVSGERVGFFGSVNVLLDDEGGLVSFRVVALVRYTGEEDEALEFDRVDVSLAKRV